MLSRYCGPWWNFTDKKGYSISWTFSTEGLSGSNLAMMMTCASGLQAVPVPVPTYWHIEYSTDGTKFTMLKKNLIIYPCPVWAYEKGDCPAGNAEYIIDLPDSLFGQKSVTVRHESGIRQNDHEGRSGQRHCESYYRQGQ